MNEQKWIALVRRLQGWKETIILPGWVIDDVKELVQENANLRELVEKQREALEHSEYIIDALDCDAHARVPNHLRYFRNAMGEIAALDQPEEEQP